MGGRGFWQGIGEHEVEPYVHEYCREGQAVQLRMPSRGAKKPGAQGMQAEVPLVPVVLGVDIYPAGQARQAVAPGVPRVGESPGSGVA